MSKGKHDPEPIFIEDRDYLTICINCGTKNPDEQEECV